MHSPPGPTVLAFPSQSRCHASACLDRIPSVSPTLAPVPHCFLSLKLFPAPQVCFFSSMYLNVVNAWFLFYLSQSIQSPAPWEICPLLKNASDFGKEERGRTGLEGKFGRRDGSRERWAEGDRGKKVGAERRKRGQGLPVQQARPKPGSLRSCVCADDALHVLLVPANLEGLRQI